MSITTPDFDGGSRLLVDLNAKNRNGWDALMFAIESRSFQVVKCLVDVRSASGEFLVNLNASQSGLGCLMVAVLSQDVEIIEHLVNLRDDEGKFRLEAWQLSSRIGPSGDTRSLKDALVRRNRVW